MSSPDYRRRMSPRRRSPRRDSDDENLASRRRRSLSPDRRGGGGRRPSLSPDNKRRRRESSRSRSPRRPSPPRRSFSRGSPDRRPPPRYSRGGRSRSPGPERDEFGRDRRRDVLDDKGKRKHREDQLWDMPQPLTLLDYCAHMDEDPKSAEGETRYRKYLEEYAKKQGKKFFDKHKDQEWFQERYDPNVLRQRRQAKVTTVKDRLAAFVADLEAGRIDFNLTKAAQGGKGEQDRGANTSSQNTVSSPSKSDKQMTSDQTAVSNGGENVHMSSEDERRGSQTQDPYYEDGYGEDADLEGHEPQNLAEENREMEVKTEEGSEEQQGVAQPSVTETEVKKEEEDTTTSITTEEQQTATDSGVGDINMNESETTAPAGETKPEEAVVKTEEKEKSKAPATPQPAPSKPVVTTGPVPSETLFIRYISPATKRQQMLDVLNAPAAGNTSDQVVELHISSPSTRKNLARVAWATFTSIEAAQKALRAVNGKRINNEYDLSLTFHKHSADSNAQQNIKDRVRVAPESVSAPARIESDAQTAFDLMKIMDNGRGGITESENPFLGAQKDQFDAMTPQDRLDRCIVYLRRVHYVCYYCGEEHEDEESLLQYCGSSHLRAAPRPPSAKAPASTGNFEKVLDAKLQVLMKGDPKLGVELLEKMISNWTSSHTTKVDENKYRCSFCDKMFKGNEFVHKHILNKHAEDKASQKFEEKAYEDQFWNNYFNDPNKITPQSLINPPPRDSVRRDGRQGPPPGKLPVDYRGGPMPAFPPPPPDYYPYPYPPYAYDPYYGGPPPPPHYMPPYPYPPPPGPYPPYPPPVAERERERERDREREPSRGHRGEGRGGGRRGGRGSSVGSKESEPAPSFQGRKLREYTDLDAPDIPDGDIF